MIDFRWEDRPRNNFAIDVMLAELDELAGDAFLHPTKKESDMTKSKTKLSNLPPTPPFLLHIIKMRGCPACEEGEKQAEEWQKKVKDQGSVLYHSPSYVATLDEEWDPAGFPAYFMSIGSGKGRAVKKAVGYMTVDELDGFLRVCKERWLKLNKE